MDEEVLRTMMRRQELDRRVGRRKVLIQNLHNELALFDEPLSKEDLVTTLAALEQLKRRSENYLRLTTPGYWRTLWLALTGQLHGGNRA